MARRGFLLLLMVMQTVAHGGSRVSSKSPIKNVVVLVLENRSFDHMLGWMPRLLGLPIDGLTGAECNPAADGLRRFCVSPDADLVVPDDPAHSFEDVLEQLLGFLPNSTTGYDYRSSSSPMSGFVRSAVSVSALLTDAVMRGFTPDRLPPFSALATDFAVFDRWFSSIPGPTQPNRLFLYSATSHGAVAHDKWNLLRGYPQRTIFDSLAADGLDYRVYFKTIPTTLFYGRLRTVSNVASTFHRYDATFRDHARRGILPALSVIEPRYFDLAGTPADDDHPAHDVANGQRLVKEVYEALRAGPQWNKTLLIITYDEHGGFYDHVPPPYVGVPSPDGIRGPLPFFFRFDRLGVRVPTIMVSPWIRKGTVVGRPPGGPTATSEYEHSSIPATIKKIFNLSSDFLTRRDAWAGTFEHMFAELEQPRTDCPETLPEVPPSTEKKRAKGDGWLSEFQRELVELAAFLNGDYMLASFNKEEEEDGAGGNNNNKKMTVKQGDAYVRRAMTRFLEASKRAKRLGANDSAIVTMRASLTTRSTSTP
ncbi:hypothetical protein GUJ93_ZPchr0001g30020 [Zizania palustris]|uniref:Uncharacterized protein n=1 Tax=Zizania palustris TaxID=103762 RepID=A0A8J5VMP8_ZIZPA|nr:hypothetical protein GUJ93_ZPchr0001g30020 [Zizania palustris]